MTLIRAFTGLRPATGRADDVAAPPYDVLNTEEARARAEGRPWSFLHISRPEIDLPKGTDQFAPEVYEKGKENFDHMLAEGVLVRDDKPSYYFYRLIMDEHVQTGLVAAASVADYDTNRIRKHEFTRPDKEDDRVRQIDTLNAQTGPVFLTYRHSDVIDQLAEKYKALNPDMDITADDGVQHTLWPVADDADIKSITNTFDVMDCLYIADGHHRSAAASRVAASRIKDNKNHSGDESYNYFLSVIFPDNQMQILDYNRVIKDLNGLTPETFLPKLTEAFTVTPTDAAAKPGKLNEFGMYLAGQWYRLTIKPELIPQNDPVGQLDISLLANNLIDPVLGISDPRRDKRIDFVGGEMAVAFAIYATSMHDLMAVADANEVMPPKSTWFEPKLADGLVSHVLD